MHEGVERLPGSFRDPSGHVFQKQGRILRSVQPRALDDYRYFVESGCAAALEARGWVIETSGVDDVSGLPEAALWLEHPRLPVVSFPYEWPFELLQEAALFHLDMQMFALDRGVALSDASAYNVSFRRGRPLFIDVLSFRRYRDGDYWLGHKQFCDHFLHPLLLTSCFGVAYQPWYRGSLEGIPGEAIEALCGWRQRLSLRMLAHVMMPVWLQRKQDVRAENALDKPTRALPKAAYRSLLNDLRRWIAGLKPCRKGASTWGDYADRNTYDDAETQAKMSAVAAFAQEAKPPLLIDMGCNSGVYSAKALASGAGDVVGFDADRDALALAAVRRRKEALSFLPLYLDAANPSPSQGWGEREREGFSRRFRGDALMALAFIHHLAIGRNIPLDEVVAWLVGLAPRGLIEFVPKTDPTIQRMLRLREDIFADYHKAGFEAALKARARIVSVETISASGRALYRYEREAG